MSRHRGAVSLPVECQEVVRVGDEYRDGRFEVEGMVRAVPVVAMEPRF